MIRPLATIWAIAGFSALLLWAIARLGQIAFEALQMPLGPQHWLLLLVSVIVMAWSEGYQGFQRGYAPRFATRVQQLHDQGTAIEILLAPLFAMGYFNAGRRRLLATYLLTVAIVALIVLFQQIPQPWRGLLDAGVIVGLSWGLLASWWCCYRSFNRIKFQRQ